MIIDSSTHIPVTAVLLEQSAVEVLTAEPISLNEIDVNVNVEEEGILSAEAAGLDERLGRLPAAYRTVLVLRFGLLGEEWTTVEAAWALGISESRVRRLELRGLRALRRMYGVGESDD